MPDRIYSIQYNGRIYDVRAADNVNPTTLFAFVQQQAGGEGGPTGPKEEENLLEKIPVVGGLLASAADIPLNVVSGLASTSKTFTDAFGADNMASDVFDTITKYAESLTSAQSREDEKTAAAIRKAAEGKGIWEEVKAAASSFMVNPLDTLASVTGSVLPFAAAARVGGPGLAFGLGAVSGAGNVKGAISDAVYARAREAGVPDEQAKIMAEEAQAYGGENLDQIGLAGALGAVAGATGFDKVLGRAIAKNAVEDVVEGVVKKEATRGLARRTVTGAGAEAIPEAAQAGQERFAQNLAEQREGYETDLMAGVAGQAAFEGLAGGVLGGIGGIPGQSTPGPIATDEEILGERQGFEAEIEATGLPEAKDPAIRARAAELMQSGNARDPVEAVNVAVYLRDQQAVTGQTEEEDSDGLDVGRGEPSLSVSDATDSGEGLAGELTESGTGPVGVAGAPAGRSNVQEVEGADPLGAPAAVAAPISIIPPIDQVSPKAQITEQLAPTGQAAPTATPVPEAAPITPAPIQAVEEAAPAAPIAPTPITPAPVQTVGEAAPIPDLNTQIDEYTSYKGKPAPAPLVESIARQYVDAMKATGIEGIITPDRIPALSEFIGNEPDTVNAFIEQARQAAPAPEQKVSDIAGTLEQNIAAPTPAPAVEDVPGLQLPPEVQEAQAEVDQFNPGFEIRFNEDLNPRRRYSYGLPGSKNLFYSPSLGPIKRRIIELEKPIQPKQTVDGVPVRKVRPGDAAGTKPKPKREAPLQIERPSIAGKLSPAQEEQQSLLLAEIDAARNSLLINNAERTELVEMLRTPTGRDLARSREWTLATAIQNDINKLKDEGSALRGEEKILAKKLGRDVRLEPEVNEEGNVTEELTAEEAALAERVANLKERTKAQNDALSKAKSGIYKRTREKLAERKDTRQKRIAQLKRNREKGLISEVVFRREMGEVRPERPMFRQAKGKATGITLEELNNAVKAITSRWGARLEPKMVQSVADLPDSIRKEMEKLGHTDAFGFYKDGKAYLIADNMNGVEDVAPTLYHEALGHLGLRARFREGLDAILDDIYRTNKGVAALADKFLSANKNLYSKDENPTARAVEEVLASASEAACGYVRRGLSSHAVRSMVP